ncbi:hypothetical protein ACFCW6_03880 [Streptomyces sp. NPDC056333]
MSIIQVVVGFYGNPAGVRACSHVRSDESGSEVHEVDHLIAVHEQWY